jgi:hypothetical protein
MHLPRSCTSLVLNRYSEPTTPDSPGQPYIPTNGHGSTKPLTWRSWNNSAADNTFDNTSRVQVRTSKCACTPCAYVVIYAHAVIYALVYSICQVKAHSDRLFDIDGGLSNWQDTANATGNDTAAGNSGTWYATSFDRPASLPTGSQVSINMTGFGQVPPPLLVYSV